MFRLSSLPSLQGKTFLVTGGNTGCGYASCFYLAAQGARVFLGARSSAKASAAVEKIKEQYPNADIHILLMDHNSLATIVKAAKSFNAKESKLNGLILNAGIMAVPYELTADGFETQMQVNYLAHWLLTYHLLPTLLSTAKSEGPGSARIVCVSSEGHQESSFGVNKILYEPEEIEKFGRFGRYGLSKLANVIHAKVLNEEYGPESKNAKQGKGEIWTGALHPGFIDSQMNEKTRDSVAWYLSWIHFVLRLFKIVRPWDEGCVSSLFVGASTEMAAGLSGLYFDEFGRVKNPNKAAMDEVEREKLEKWTTSVMLNNKWI
jgi:NAD(P)-dependent dehydrogenase (short-subunit alcohol dehydrogenase family)